VVNHTFSKTYAEDKWELYHVEEDYSEKYDVADKYPEKLRELQDAWLIEAAKYHVFPMPPNGQHAYRKQLQDTYRFMSVKPAETFVYENIILPHDLSKTPTITNTTHKTYVEVTRNNTEESGVLFAKGDRFAGVTFFVKDNRLHYVYNTDGDKIYSVVSSEEIPLGNVTLSYEFNVVEDDLANVSIFINNNPVGTVAVESFIYTSSEVATLKANKYTSVSDADYEAPFEYPAVIDKITFEVAATGLDAAVEIEKGLHTD
jgi:arylsulfatase